MKVIQKQKPSSNAPLQKIRKIILNLSGYEINDSTVFGRRLLIDKETRLGMNVRIGNNVHLMGARISDDTAIEDNVIMENSKIGKGSRIQTGTILKGSKKNIVRIGNDVAIGYHWLIDGAGGLRIEDHVNMGSHGGGIYTIPFSNSIWNSSHVYGENGRESNIIIGSCSWIGGKVSIFGGIRIGDHTAIMPNSVVIDDIPPFTMAGGIPAKPLRRIIIKKGKVIFEKLK